VNSNEELANEVVTVSTEPVLNVPGSTELLLRFLRILELLRVRVIWVLELVVGRSSWAATSTVVVSAKVVNSHCCNLGCPQLFSSVAVFDHLASWRYK